MKIIVGDNLLSKIDKLFNFNNFSKTAILTDKNIPRLLINKIEKSLKKELIKIIIPAGERMKTIKTAEKIWKVLFKNGFDRCSLLINLGGGMISDLGGFAAATFMRGINFLNIPTTLLAQVDASIGGKTGIDFYGIKNAIGVFKEPIGVIVDVDALDSLPERELKAAFAEIIKHGVISEEEYFNLVTAKKPNEFNKKELIKIIKQSIKIKSEIVKKDLKEKNWRKALNYGHTIGHAVEALSWKTKKPLLHGEAIAIGMVGEARLANLLGMLSKKDLKRIEESLLNVGLPIKITSITLENIMETILLDKKNTNGIINWTLPKKIGEVAINIKAPKNLVIKAIESIQR